MWGSLSEGFRIISLYLWTLAHVGTGQLGDLGGVGRAGTCHGGHIGNIRKLKSSSTKDLSQEMIRSRKNENSPMFISSMKVKHITVHP